MFKQKNFFAGIMLIEFIIAMMISVFLLGILGMIYLAAEKNNAAQSAYLTILDNGRIASELLTRHIHAAGHIGCARLTDDFPLTSYLNYTLSSRHKIIGTDNTLTVSGGSPESGYLLQSMLTATVIYVSTELHFMTGDIVMVSDCESAEIFEVKSIQKIHSGMQKIISTMPLHKQYGQYAEVNYFEKNMYFIADTKHTDASGATIHALFVRNHRRHITELVEGVDAISITYDVVQHDQLVMLKAQQVQDWAAVVGVKIELSLSAINAYPLHKKLNRYVAVNE
jgi:hypothetical protein